MISVVVLFAMAVSNLVVSSIRQAANVNRANEAFYAAEGALESGLMENQNVGAAGYTATKSVTYCEPGGVCPSASVRVQGQVPTSSKIDNQYIMPTPGGGTVGKDCDPLKAVTSGIFTYTYHSTGETPVSAEANAIDHPCNWNKIKVGQTIGVPLYMTSATDVGTCTEDTSGEGGIYICNPTDLGLTTLKIKVRTPCENGDEMCPASLRFDLDTERGDEKFNHDDPIVAWQIVGASEDGKESYTLVPNVEGDWDEDLDAWDTITASVIYESKINLFGNGGAPTFLVLLQTRLGIEKDTSPYNETIGSIINFLKNVSPWGDRIIMKPVLKLSVIHSLESIVGGDKIPFLEYQVVTEISNTYNLLPADTAQTVTAEALSGTFKQVLEVKLPQETGLLEYVLQQ